MRRRVGIAVGVVGILLVVLELAAVPLATRVIGAVVGRCLSYDSLELTSVARPVVPRLLLGRAHDVELHATGIASGPYRVAEARLTMPEAILPWAVAAPDAVTADLAVRVEEADIEGALAEVVPLGGQLEVDLAPQVATLGSTLLSVTVDVEVDVDEAGTVWLRPVRGAELFERFGLGPSYPSGDLVRVEALEIGTGELRGDLALQVVPGVGGGRCEEPLTGPPAGPPREVGVAA